MQSTCCSTAPCMMYNAAAGQSCLRHPPPPFKHSFRNLPSLLPVSALHAAATAGQPKTSHHSLATHPTCQCRCLSPSPLGVGPPMSWFRPREQGASFGGFGHLLSALTPGLLVSHCIIPMPNHQASPSAISLPFPRFPHAAASAAPHGRSRALRLGAFFFCTEGAGADHRLIGTTDYSVAVTSARPSSVPLA